MQDQSLVPHPVDLVEADLAESRKLLADCVAIALDRDNSHDSRLDFMGAATRLLRHNAAAAALLLREAHTCLRDQQHRPKPPSSVCRKRRPGESAQSGWGFDDREARYLAEREAEKNLKTTSGANDSSEENSKITAEPNIRFV